MIDAFVNLIGFTFSMAFRNKPVTIGCFVWTLSIVACVYTMAFQSTTAYFYPAALITVLLALYVAARWASDWVRRTNEEGE